MKSRASLTEVSLFYKVDLVVFADGVTTKQSYRITEGGRIVHLRHGDIPDLELIAEPEDLAKSGVEADDFALSTEKIKPIVLDREVVNGTKLKRLVLEASGGAAVALQTMSQQKVEPLGHGVFRITIDRKRPDPASNDEIKANLGASDRYPHNEPRASGMPARRLSGRCSSLCGATSDS